jgi:hypothetical protein
MPVSMTDWALWPFKIVILNLARLDWFTTDSAIHLPSTSYFLRVLKPPLVFNLWPLRLLLGG